jgi:type I restriction enzyme S subunit
VRVSLRDVCAAVARAEPRTVFKDTFEYVDISSIDPKTRTITEPRTISVNEAPSRARQILKGDDVLFSTVRPYLRNIAHVEKSLDGQFASTGFSVIRPADGICGRYLFHLVNSNAFVATVLPFQRGSSYPAVLDEDVKAIEIPIPPTAEQERIVAALDALFARLDAADEGIEKAQALLKQHGQSVLFAAVTGRLTEDWRDEHGQSADRGRSYESGGLVGELPPGWDALPLPKLGELARGKSKHRPRNDPALYGGPYPFLQTGKVRESRGRITSYDQTYSEAGLKQSRLWPKGTLCITIAANIAETGILEFDACFPDSVVGFISSGRLPSEYVQFYLATVRDHLERFAPATAQKNINLDTLDGVVVPAPPREETALIVARVSNLISELAELKEAAKLARTQPAMLRQSILASAFRGELVPQGPEDESAESLLERIRSRRATEVPKKRVARKPKQAAA